MPSRGKKLTLLFATLAVVVLGAAGWFGWPYLQFYWRFETLGLNEQGFLEYRHRQTGIIMVRLPGGRSWMGAQNENPEARNYDPEAEENEGPVHEVTLSPFLIGKYETSVIEWRRVTGTRPRGPTSEDRHPVQYLFWGECEEFSHRVGLRLPTEAQWEYACRAGTEGMHAGPGVLDEMGWYRENCESKRQLVGEKRANDFGLHDMHGGAEEWCQDAFDDSFYASREARIKDPVCTSDPTYRVSRGGSWRVPATKCRSAARQKRRLGPQNCAPGFRVVFYPLPD